MAVTGKALGCRPGVHHRSEAAGVNMVGVEVVFLLPWPVGIELGGRNFVEVDKGHVLLLCHLTGP